MRIAESGNVRLVLIPGPTRAELAPIAQDVHQGLAGGKLPLTHFKAKCRNSSCTVKTSDIAIATLSSDME